MKLISIIVPVYNVTPYLPLCLDSLVNQTYRDLEIICVNDGSTDDSLVILEKYARKDGRIKVINQVNLGLSGARNTGIQQAHGEWMMFVDSDDWMDIQCCETLIQNINEKTDLCFFNYIRESNRKSSPQYIFDKERRSYTPQDIHQLYVRLIAPTGKELAHPEKLDSLSTAWGKIYKSSIIQEHQIQFVSTKEIGTEDLLFNVYYFTWIKEAIYLPHPFYHYRKNNITSLTKLYKPRLSEQWQLLFSKIEDWIRPMNAPDLEEAIQYRRALSLIGQGLNITFSNQSITNQYRQLMHVIKEAKYRTAITTLPLNYFPIHWKLFYGMAQKQLVWGVLITLKIMNLSILR